MVNWIHVSITSRVTDRFFWKPGLHLFQSWQWNNVFWYWQFKSVTFSSSLHEFEFFNLSWDSVTIKTSFHSWLWFFSLAIWQIIWRILFDVFSLLINIVLWLAHFFIYFFFSFTFFCLFWKVYLALQTGTNFPIFRRFMHTFSNQKSNLNKFTVEV